MDQKPKKKKRKLPEDITERTDREVMEKLFGKRVLKEADKIIGRDEDTEKPEGE